MFIPVSWWIVSTERANLKTERTAKTCYKDKFGNLFQLVHSVLHTVSLRRNKKAFWYFSYKMTIFHSSVKLSNSDKYHFVYERWVRFEDQCMNHRQISVSLYLNIYLHQNTMFVCALCIYIHTEIAACVDMFVYFWYKHSMHIRHFNGLSEAETQLHWNILV